jgi:hypothetical protein
MPPIDPAIEYRNHNAASSHSELSFSPHRAKLFSKSNISDGIQGAIIRIDIPILPT